MLETFKIIFMAIINGITSVLPTSSLGHFVLLKEVFAFSDESFNAEFYYSFFLISTGLAMYLCYFKVHRRILKNLFKSKRKITTEAGAAYRTAGKNVLLSLIPLAVLFIPMGKLGFVTHLSKYFLSDGSLIFVGIASIFCAILMFISHWYLKTEYNEKTNLLSTKNAVFFGIYQIPAYILPGLSHISVGASRTAVSDIDIRTVLKETYLYIAPAFIVTGIIRSILSFNGGEGLDLIAAAVGFVLSFAFSMIVLNCINKYFNNKTYRAFAIYTIIFGVALTGTALFTMLA